MAIALVVVSPFAHYQRGERITDQATVKALLEDHPHRVNKIVVPDAAPAPAEEKAEQKK
jgi:hypothetical protein